MSDEQTNAVHSPEVGPVPPRDLPKMYAAALTIAQRFAPKAREFMEREGRLARVEESLRSKAARLEHDRVAVQEREKQMEARELELEQLRDRYEVGSARMRTEVESLRQSLAARDAEIQTEHERIERDSTVLQDAFGVKGQELAIREEALTAREAELRAEKEDVEARVRELELRERQADSGTTRLSAQAEGLVRLDADLNARAAQFDETVRTFDTKEQEKLREWEALETAFRSEQRQMTATAETRSAELARRMEEVDARERSLRAAAAQLELERSRLEAQVKAADEQISEADVAWKHSEARLAELKALEANVLPAQRALESERAAWALKRSEELRQLEATRAAIAAQAEQAASLIAESQGRALVADEAEMAAKRQAGEVATQLALLERRQSEVDKSERKAQTTLARLREAYAVPLKIVQRFAPKARELMEREGRLARVEETLRSKAAGLAHVRAAVQETQTQLEAQQLELEQLRNRYEVESARLRTETDSVRRSLAEGYAEIQAERGRVEHESTVLQDTFGAKAKEIAIREEALTTRESELRAKEEDVEARIRELASKERQAESRTAELSAQAERHVRREADLNARAAQFDDAVRKFEAEEREKRQDWEALQTAFRTEQQQVRATAESRSAELARRMEEVDARDRSLRAATAQLQLERSRLEAQVKAADEQFSEAGVAWKRSEAWHAELEAQEANLLRDRQSFESERAAWAVKRSEELMQLEARREATAVQAQQAASLIAESKGRALAAEEAERAAKHQAAEAATQIALLERLRSEVDKSERKAQATLARLEFAYGVPLKIARRLAMMPREFLEREGRLARVEETLRAKAAGLANERAAAKEAAMLLEAQRLELDQLQDQYEEDSVRLRTETEATRESLAAQEAQIRSEQERIERDSRFLEETLSARSEEMALRDKALAARESELRVKGQEVESRIRHLERRKSQAEQEAQANFARLQEASQKLAVKEAEVAAATRVLEAHLARIEEFEREAAKSTAGLQSRKAELDRESTRLANLSEHLTSRPKALQHRTAISAAKPADQPRKEGTLATEPEQSDSSTEDVSIRPHSRRSGVRASEDVVVDRLMTRVILYILAAILAGGFVLWFVRR